MDDGAGGFGPPMAHPAALAGGGVLQAQEIGATKEPLVMLATHLAIDLGRAGELDALRTPASSNQAGDRTMRTLHRCGGTFHFISASNCRRSVGVIMRTRCATASRSSTRARRVASSVA